MLGYCILLFLFVLVIMCIKIEIAPDESCSRIYGVAYWKVVENRGVCYPIPFNIAAHFTHKLYRKLRQPKFILNDIKKTK